MPEALIDELLELTPIDTDTLTRDYAENNQTAVSYRTPAPGSYTLRLPTNLSDDAFVVRSTKDGGRRYLEIRLDNGSEGLTIVGGEFDGLQARYLRVTTLMQKATKFNKASGSSEVITDAEGHEKSFSDAIDLLKNFGITEVPQTKDEWMAAIRALEGRETPSKVYLSWEGKARGTMVEGWPKRLYAAAFKDSTGSYQPFIELTAQVQFAQKRRGETVTVQPGDSYRVYPNLCLGRRGFAVKK